jgi:hypothetical protein
MSKIPAKILKLLKDARQNATLETASFDWPDSHMTAKCRSGNFDGRPDEFIKERVRLHHQTWIIQRIDQVIEWAEAISPADRGGK